MICSTSLTVVVTPFTHLGGSMSKKLNHLILAAAVTGLFAGSSMASLRAADADAAKDKTVTEKADAGKHACKAMNACKGQGGCKTEKNECKGHNACKGTGGCATVKHECKGHNACKGQGGCKTDKNECKAKNACKGLGGCKVS